jgi:HEAT repeat protein
MGLLGKLFGGGTELEVSLSSSNVIAGGVVAGKVTVTGGKKPLTMTSLNVSVVFVHVTTTNDSPLPKIELRQLVATTVVANQALPPGKAQAFDFTAQLPDGLDPKGSYKVIARADIPGVKDPSAEADFKVITPGAKRGILGALMGNSESDVLARYPGLLSHEEDEIFSALCELRGDAYGDGASKLVAIAPWLLRFVKTGPEDLRDEALETWATLLNGRARASDIKELEALALDARELGRDLRRALVTAVTKFADEGAGALLQRLAADQDPEIREQVARSLYLDADENLPGRFEMVAALTRDGDVSVRRAAASALAPFTDNPTAMQLGVEIANNDPSPDVRAEALEAIALSHYHGMLELVLGTYHAHLASPSSEVRKAIAGRLSALPADPRVAALVQALLGDSSSEVRKRMAWSGVNMSDHPALAPMFQHVAERDGDDEVRAEAVYGMRGFLEPAQAIAYARARLAADPTERMAWSVLSVARSHDDEPSARAFLGELARSPFSDVASSAREALG